jgi:Htaa
MKRLLSALALACLVAALAPGAASAAGTTTIDLRGKAVKSLRTQGVEIAGFGGASARRKRVVLRVRSGLVSSTAFLNQRGGLVLRRRVDGRRRKVKLGRLQVRLGKASEIVGQIGARRFAIFRLKAVSRTLSLDSRNGTATVRGAVVSLTRAAARLIKKRLRLRRLPAGAFGLLRVDALVSGSDAPGGGGPGGGGPGGGGPPVSQPIGDEPPVLARPASAVNLSGAQITWRPKPSFIRYVNSGEGTSVFAGATEGPPGGAECPVETGPALVYSFHFPYTHGWYDPATGTAGVYFGGGVRFRYTAHGIDLDAKEPEVELNGQSSRAIFRLDGRGETNPGNKRAVMVDLDVGAAPPVEGPGSVSYERIPATIPVGGSQSVFADFYTPGDTFGCISVSFNYPAGA